MGERGHDRLGTPQSDNRIEFGSLTSRHNPKNQANAAGNASGQKNSAQGHSWFEGREDANQSRTANPDANANHAASDGKNNRFN
jgi:hypothetical protein